MLQHYILKQRSQKDLLLMTHIVIGYPSLDESSKIVSTMITNGADLIELQIPGADTGLDGKLISDANQQALQQGVTVEKCLCFARKLIQQYHTPFIFVVYKNSLDHYGWLRFMHNAAQIGIQGIIVPDLPKTSGLYYQAMAEAEGTTLIPVVFPASSYDELSQVKHYKGFCYCATSDNVTGSRVQFNQRLRNHLHNIKQRIPIPTATGFGIKDKQQVNFLRGYTDIAVIGTRLLQIYNARSIIGVEEFLQQLIKTPLTIPNKALRKTVADSIK